MTRVFDTSTIQGIRAAERCQQRMYEQFESVNVYAIGLDRVQIVGLKPISKSNRGQHPAVVPDRQ